MAGRLAKTEESGQRDQPADRPLTARADLRLEVVPAGDEQTWQHAASLLFAYQGETAVEVGAPRPGRPEDVWPPVRQETIDPASVLPTYVIAYYSGEPVGGMAVVAHDGLSAMLKRCYVVQSWRRRGVARSLVEHVTAVAVDRGVSRLVLDVLPSRLGAIAAWRRMGFVDAKPWGDPAMAYFERRIPSSGDRTWLGVRRGEVALRESDPRWQAVFAHHAELLGKVLGVQTTGIEHVGSTAVEGLVAKPIVDVAVGIRADVDESKVVRELEAKGYRFGGDKGSDGGLLFVVEDEPAHRIVHVHAVREGDPQWQRYLRTRDRLRTEVDLREAYATLKKDLARRFSADRPAYTEGKETFLDETASPVDRGGPPAGRQVG